jgi:hypothetical protein
MLMIKNGEYRQKIYFYLNYSAGFKKYTTLVYFKTKLVSGGHCKAVALQFSP